MWILLWILNMPVLNSVLQLESHIDNTVELPNQKANVTRIIRQFRAMVPDILQNYNEEFFQKDAFLLRFLRVNNFDVHAANRKLRQVVKWRADNRMDSILHENVLPLPFTPYKYDGLDKEGHPVLVLNLAPGDLRRLILEGKRENMIRIFHQMMEVGLAVLKNLTRTTGAMQVVVILDVNGFNLRQHLCFQCISVYFEWLQNYENYYFGSLKYFVVINMNRIFASLKDLVMPVLTEETQKAIRLFGTQKSEWSKFLLSIISSDQLNHRFGGTRPD